MQIPFTESERTAISYGLMASFGFMLMLFVHNYCKYNTAPRPAGVDTQFDAALLETSTSIPFISRLVEAIDDWFAGPLPGELKVPEGEREGAEDIKPIVKKRSLRFSVQSLPMHIRPIQPKRTVSCPATLYNGAAAFSPTSDDGEFFFADLPSPASAP